jgi:hypothetical protein
MKEKKARVECVPHGRRRIVAGGGVALLRARSALDALKLDDAEQAGVNIVRRAVEEPLHAGSSATGQEGAVVLEKVREAKGASDQRRHRAVRGFDQGGHHRPTKVVRTALRMRRRSRGLPSPSRRWWTRSRRGGDGGVPSMPHVPGLLSKPRSALLCDLARLRRHTVCVSPFIAPQRDSAARHLVRVHVFSAVSEKEAATMVSIENVPPFAMGWSLPTCTSFPRISTITCGVGGRVVPVRVGSPAGHRDRGRG